MKTETSQDRRVGSVLWIAGMCGVIAVTMQVLPQMLRDAPLPLPLWAVTALSLLQSSVILSLMVCAGLKLGPKCDLGAPLLSDRRMWSWRRILLHLVPAFLAGILGGVALALAPRLAPPELLALDGKISLPLLSRVLYGGITEELLVRWGAMTLILWALTRLRGRLSLARGYAVAVAIVASALLFAVGHLPAASHFVGHLDRDIVLYIVGMNAVFGILFGWIFHRRGIESAIVAHALTHVVAVGLAGAWSALSSRLSVSL